MSAYEDASQDSEMPPPPPQPKKVTNKTDGLKMAGGYIIGWIVFIVIFKYFYGKYRQSQKDRKGWFGKNPDKETYEELLRTNPDDEEGLRKALMRRAITDMRRLMELNEEKESVYNLMRTGAISEAMWSDFKQAESDMQLELFEVQAEAETFKKDWSQSILKEAAMLLHKEKELIELKKAKDAEEKKQKEAEKKAQKQKEHEERMTEEQIEKANRVRERLMAEAEQATNMKKTKAK